MSDLRDELDALMAAARQMLESRYGDQCEIAAVLDRDVPAEIAAVAGYIRQMRVGGSGVHGMPPPLPHEMPPEPRAVPPVEARYAPRRG